MLIHCQSVIVFVVALTGVLLGQTNITVPSPLITMAQRPPWEFAMLLANASVPSGLEVRDIDVVRPLKRPNFALDRSVNIPVADLIKAFNSQHTDYHAELANGVFVVRPTVRPARFLDQPSHLTSPIVATGLMGAARRLFAPLDPSLASGLGTTGSFVNASPDDLGENIPISVNGDRNVIDSLNQIVLQSPRTWYVVTTKRQNGETLIIRFGFIHGQGITIEQTLPAPPVA